LPPRSEPPTLAGPHRRYFPNPRVHALLPAQIGRLLRLRVLHELARLAQLLPLRARGPPLVRRLTRAELDALALAGAVPPAWNGAGAVLVVPPVNRDPRTGRRPRPEAGLELLPAQAPDADDVRVPLRRALPLAVMYPAGEGEGEARATATATVPRAEVPLYNGVAMFPDREQRAALHAGLARLLHIERRARFKEEGRRRRREQQPQRLDGAQAGAGDAAASGSGATSVDTLSMPSRKKARARGDEKMSHAFLICSDADTLLRADAVPLLVALWRVRMWEGGGFGEGSVPSAWEEAAAALARDRSGASVSLE
jgi:hypothetical protein